MAKRRARRYLLFCPVSSRCQLQTSSPASATAEASFSTLALDSL